MKDIYDVITASCEHDKTKYDNTRYRVQTQPGMSYKSLMEEKARNEVYNIQLLEYKYKQELNNREEKMRKVNVKKCQNLGDLARMLGYGDGGHGYAKARDYVAKNNLDISHFPKLKRTRKLNIMECNSFADVVRNLGLPNGGYGYRKAKEYVKVYNMDTSHF